MRFGTLAQEGEDSDGSEFKGATVNIVNVENEKNGVTALCY